MSSAKKMLLSAAGVGGAGLDIADVFSTFLFTGTGANKTITNGIDLSGEGGLVWIKGRSLGYNNVLTDTERGVTQQMSSNQSDGQQAYSTGLTAFNSNGFSIGSNGQYNNNNSTMASWTFRKAEKFFDIVTYTGNGSGNRAIAHNLGSSPGMVIIKRSSATENWVIWHRSLASNKMLTFTTGATTGGTPTFDSSLMSSTTFGVNTDSSSNANGSTYVAYLFAHNDGDGEFGPDADQDIISCGGYTGAHSTNVAVNLGWEPQFVLLKNTTDTSGDSVKCAWNLMDNMRGLDATGVAYRLAANSNAVEGGMGTIILTSTGFSVESPNTNDNGDTHIYMAIRAPMITPPAAATDVFKGYSMTGLSANAVVDIDFPPDMVLHTHALGGKNILTRLLGSLINKGSAGSSKRNWLITNGTDALDTGTHGIYYNNDNTSLALNSNYGGASNADITSFQWKRAKGFFDVVAYSGNGSYPRNISHSLGVVPEMMWVKTSNAADNWRVYSKDMTVQQEMLLNGTYAAGSTGSWGTGGRPTDSVFIAGSANTNYSGRAYIAYLFATLAGVSKVGSVSHSGSSTDVDCGFSNGARFVLLKRTDSTGHWYVFDTISGIIAGNDPYYILNSSTTIDGINYANQITNSDFIDPLASGFQISGDFTDGDYIFYAIA